MCLKIAQSVNKVVTSIVLRYNEYIYLYFINQPTPAGIIRATTMKTVLEIACQLLKWNGGTVHQVKEEMRKMSIQEQHGFLRRIESNLSNAAHVSVETLRALQNLRQVTLEGIEFKSSR